MKKIPVLLTVFSLAILPAISIADKSGPEFSHNYKEALAKAKSSNKPLILIFSASWCPPCQYMKQSVYPSKQVQPFHNSFVWAYLDADVRENAPILDAYGASEIPHIEFLTSDGRSMGHIAEALPPEQFAGLLGKVIALSKGKRDPMRGSGRRGSGRKP